MMDFATELAIQLKDTFGFVLGLGGMYTTVRSGFVTFVVSSGEAKRLAKGIDSIGLAANRAQFWGRFAFFANLALFAVAIALYAGPLSHIDPRALRAGTAELTVTDAIAIYVLATIAVSVLVMGLWVDALRQRSLDLVALSKTISTK